MGNDADNARLSNVWLQEDKLPGFKEYAVSFFEECRAFQMERYVTSPSPLPLSFLSFFSLNVSSVVLIFRLHG